MKSKLLLFWFFAWGSGLQAQELQKLYFPNGKLAFEGKYTLIWTETEPFEYLNRISPQDNDNYELSAQQRKRDDFNAYKDIVPNRLYMGKCKFYHVDGSLMAEGMYKNGAKHGDFKLYHSNGKLSATQSYEKGMATGQWKSWDKEGNLISEFHYKPIPDSVIDEVAQYLQLEISGSYHNNQEATNIFKDMYGTWFEDVLSQNNNPVLKYQREGLKTLRDKIKKVKYYTKAYKHGSFKVWQNKQLSFHISFEHNKPVGKWLSYENGQPAFELDWKDGKIVAARDYNQPANNFGTKEYNERLEADKQKRNELEASAVSIDLSSLSNSPHSAPAPQTRTEDRNEIFRTVQEAASPSNNWTEYVKQNLRYPAAARNANVSGRVTVEFVVERNGSLTGIKVVRGKELGHGLPEEAIRLLKASPKWRPAKQNGKTVRSYFTVPINITP